MHTCGDMDTCLRSVAFFSTFGIQNISLHFLYLSPFFFTSIPQTFTFLIIWRLKLNLRPRNKHEYNNKASSHIEKRRQSALYMVLGNFHNLTIYKDKQALMFFFNDVNWGHSLRRSLILNIEIMGKYIYYLYFHFR